MLGKQKPNFATGSTIIKVNRAFKKGNQNLSQRRFPDGRSGIDDLDFVIFEQCETHEQFKIGENFL